MRSEELEAKKYKTLTSVKETLVSSWQHSHTLGEWSEAELFGQRGGRLQIEDKEQKNMPLEAHYDRFVLKRGTCGEELTKFGRMAPLTETAAAAWGLIVEPNGTYDYACSTCLTKSTVDRSRMSEIPTFFATL